MRRTLTLVCCMGVMAAADLAPTTEYRITRLNGRDVAAKGDLRTMTLQLDAKEGTVAGCSGVNRYAGGYTTKSGVLTLKQMLSTMMAGSDTAMACEQELLKVLAEPLTISAVEKGFELTGKGGSLRLVAP